MLWKILFKSPKTWDKLNLYLLTSKIKQHQWFQHQFGLMVGLIYVTNTNIK